MSKYLVCKGCGHYMDGGTRKRLERMDAKPMWERKDDAHCLTCEERLWGTTTDARPL